MDISLQSILDNLLQEVWFELTFLLVVSLFAGFLFSRFGQPRWRRPHSCGRSWT